MATVTATTAVLVLLVATVRFTSNTANNVEHLREDIRKIEKQLIRIENKLDTKADK